MDYQVTVRYGRKSQRYLTLAVSAPDAPSALRWTADRIPQDVAGDIDLVELRPAPDFEKRFPDADPS